MNAKLSQVLRLPVFFLNFSHNVGEMHLKKKIMVALSLLLVGVLRGEEGKSFYSTTAEKFVAEVKIADGEPEDYYKAVCPGYGGYELIYQAGDARSWLDVRRGKVTSDLWAATMEAGRGFFVAKANDVVEWRGVMKEGVFKPYAIIYRVTAQNPEKVEEFFSSLVVVALKEGESEVIGTAHGKGEDAKAKALADQWWKAQK